jgi:hypothetical protein
MFFLLLIQIFLREIFWGTGGSVSDWITEMSVSKGANDNQPSDQKALLRQARRAGLAASGKGLWSLATLFADWAAELHGGPSGTAGRDRVGEDAATSR